MKEYLNHTPSQEEIDFFCYDHDENGYYIELPDESQACEQWSEYWSQFSQEEILAIIL